MDIRSLFTQRPSFPAPCLTATAWLLAPIRSIGAEGDAELRQTLMRGLEALLASAAVTLFIAALAAVRYPTVPLLCWLALDLTIMSVRAPLVLHMLRFARNPSRGQALRPWTVDLFVYLGTLWSALLGAGTMACLCTDDPGLSVLAALLAMGTIGAQGVRSPGSPRLNGIQMGLIIIPFTAGALISAIPGIHWAVLLTPIYLLGMISITRQLHEDYVALMVARIENRKRALHCPLTGLPNRSFFLEGLAVVLDKGETARGPVVVMYLDLDGFKGVNDRFGHAAGDTLLRQVADRLSAWAQPGTLVARLGGDEFAILLRGGNPDDAATGARSIIDSLGRSYDLGVETVSDVGVSIGLAISAETDEIEDLLLRADRALYAAKRAGKGIFRWQIEASTPAEGAEGKGLHAIGLRMREIDETGPRTAESRHRVAG